MAIGRLGRIAGGAGGVLVALAASMIGLSEMGEVVVIHSAAAGGAGARATRIWVVDDDAGLLVRGSAGKGWVADAVRAGTVELDRAGATRRYRVVERPGDDARRDVNARMRAKYGFADRAIGWLRDYDASTPLRLVPLDAAPAPRGTGD